jgi:hypothetical protein
MQNGDPLDSVIEKYTAASPGPSREMLAEWVARYPQYKEDLTDFTIDWTLASPITPPPVEESGETSTAMARHMEIVRAILDGQAPSTRGLEPIRSLVAEARERGLSRKEFAAALDLSIALVDKLDRRLVRYRTIPAAIVASLSRVLATGTERVALYLEGPPLLPQGASYRAEQAPAVPEAQDFAEAVSSDRTLTPERKEELLALANESE